MGGADAGNPWRLKKVYIGLTKEFEKSYHTGPPTPPVEG